MFFWFFVFISFLIAENKLWAEGVIEPPKKEWTFEKWNGAFDKAKLQRGFQIYKEVCATCHGLKRIRFRELKAIGFTDLEIKALAASYDIHDGPNDEGEMFDRPGLPSDAMPWIYKNAKQAKAANNGAFPPDLSLIVKARKYGADYIYALLTGYCEPPKEIAVSNGQYYNKYFSGKLIAMAPPLTDGQVTYADGRKATVSQMAEDVTNFLAWAAEPEMEERKQDGFVTLMFLLFMTVLFYFTMRRIWQDVK